jgi:hypothetical protein
MLVHGGMELHTARAVIEALGGTAAVMAMTRSGTDNAVINWKRKNAFPPRFYVLMTRRLLALGHSAPDSLWGMVE